MPASDVPYDDPAGRTRFAWARTLLVALVVSLFVERLFFAGSWWSLVILGAPPAVIALVTVLRSRQLRAASSPAQQSGLFAIIAVCVLTVAFAAMVGVLIR